MNELIKHEIEKLADGGLIRPADVVEAARSPKSALHDYFTWDDGEAAEKWRLEEARRLIRVVVVRQVNEAEPVRAFVSLSTDRVAGGGYRALAQVMDDEDLNERMLQDALDELGSFQRKYERLAALKPVFKAAEQVKRTRKRVPEQAVA